MSPRSSSSVNIVDSLMFGTGIASGIAMGNDGNSIRTSNLTLVKTLT